MMKRSLPLLPLFLLLPLAAACDDSRPVVVRATQPGGEPIAGVPVRLLPYDRAAVLDSLAAAAEAPQPALPQELVQRLAAPDTEPPPEPAPGDTTPPLTRAQALARLDTIRALRRAWAAEAYAGYEEAVRERARIAGRGELVDTTDATGTVRLSAEPGQWWAWVRYALPGEELEWVVPVRVPEGGDSVVVELTPEKAERRPFF